MTNRHRDLSLERSKFAWKCANDMKTILKGNFKEYVTLVKNVPTSLSNNGLGQTLAFLNSKPNNNAYKKLFEQLQKWLAKQIYQSADANPNIIVIIQTGEVDKYRHATKETMEFITWLKLHSSSLNIESSNDVSTKETSDTADKTSANVKNNESKTTIEFNPETTGESLERK